MDLGPSCIPHIISYICSPRCRLRSLTINGNMLGFGGIKTIIKALRGNYTLISLDLHANDAWTQEDAQEYYRLIDTDKEDAHVRNRLLRRMVFTEALQLLRHARPILLQPRHSPSAAPSATLDTPTLSSLPTEIILYILTFLSPKLSPAQRLRIVEYASDAATLPPLLPSLRRPIQHVRRASDPMTDRADLDAWIQSMDCDAFEPNFGSNGDANPSN